MYSTTNNKTDTNKIEKLISRLSPLLYNCDLHIDSRKVDNNSIFCAYPGVSVDGRDFVNEAIASGARCIIEEGNFNLNKDNHYYIENLRDIVGIIASTKYRYPTHVMKVIGVTGTNGKTSITNLLSQVYTNLGIIAGVIGTLGAGIFPDIEDYLSTTPDPITLQQLLFNFAASKASITSIEVSSHALDQGRVNGIEFDTAIFTNLTQDHLDYHKTMRNYFYAKEGLFHWRGLKNAIINIDDEYGRELYNKLKLVGSLNVLSYGINSGDISAKDIKVSLSGLSFTLVYKNEQLPFAVKIIGKFNIYNVLAVISYLLLYGLSIKVIQNLIGQIKPVPGRMDAIFTDYAPLVVIDYSHTPDALEKALLSLNEIKGNGKVYCVFGCGGNRDAIKRPIMGNIASTNCDYLIITSDNPRNEPPSNIISQIKSGIKTTNNYEIIENRKDAIIRAINMANSNDVVLIAGKGHEKYQEINGVRHHFSDKEIASWILENYRGIS